MNDLGKMKTLEGVCKFCGQVQNVHASSQEDANRIATLQCNCDEAEAYRRKEDLMELINQTCMDLPKESGFESMPEKQVSAIRAIGVLVADRDLEKATIDVADSHCVIGRHKDGTFVFKRSKALSLGGDV